MTATDLTTTWADITQLRPHPKNARNGDVDMIAESLVVNGQYRPIVIARDGTILAGNHTYMAAMGLGWKNIAVVMLDVDPMEPAALRVMLTDNRTADLGNYDDGLLVELLNSLDATDGLIGTGYIEADLNALRDLLTVDSYYDSDEYAAKARDAAAAANRTISILGVPEEVWEWWRNQPGRTDLERLTSLM